MNVVPMQQPEYIPDFADFYALFPRHEARKDALKAWGQMTEADRLQAIIAIAAWRPVFQQRGVDYTPLPATWLRGERYTDELPHTAMSMSHVPFKEGATPVARGVLPDEVRAILRKLTGRTA